MLIHTGSKTYNCGVYRKQFFQAVNLKCHLRIHTGEKTVYTGYKPEATHAYSYRKQTFCLCVLLKKSFSRLTTWSVTRLFILQRNLICVTFVGNRFSRLLQRNLIIVAFVGNCFPGLLTWRHKCLFILVTHLTIVKYVTNSSPILGAWGFTC